MPGPTLPISQHIHQEKYRSEGETFYEAMSRIADALKDGDEHFARFREILLDMRFLPGGRVQAAMGAPRQVTAFNCFVMDTVPDSMEGIMRVATEAAYTMRMGGGVGYDFSTIRPRGDLIRSLDSRASGPVSFMGIYDAVCKTIASAGHRRGAQMAVLRVDHPDIEEFIRAKQNSTNLTAFNISIAATDEFMTAVLTGNTFDLRWGGRVYKTVDARNLWNEIMRSTWDWAEPGILFIDQINRQNNLWYCENIVAVNPCGEQPLPPYGACLLGSLNLARYVREDGFDVDALRADIPHVVRAMDNIIDRTIYPLPQQRQEALAKRRMGLGVTGLANAGEALGFSYGSSGFLGFTANILETIRDETYRASALLAAEKGAFPLFNAEKYLRGEFIKRLPQHVRDLIARHGIRNSHLTSIAPTGTISLCADNVSSGIEPVFAHETRRTILTSEGQRDTVILDYGLREWGVRGKTSDECSVDDHLGVLIEAQKWVDSAISKTCNVGSNVTFEEFKQLYQRAWAGGCKGATTFRAAGKRFGVLRAEPESSACTYDPSTGTRSCEA